MKVKLTRNWFTKNRRLYLSGEYDFPEKMRDELPKSAVVLADEDEEEDAPKKPAAKAAATSK